MLWSVSKSRMTLGLAPMVQVSRPGRVVLLFCPFSSLFGRENVGEITQSHTTAHTLAYNVVVQSHPFPLRVSFVYSCSPRSNSPSPAALNPLPANLPSRSCHLDFTPPFRVKITLLTQMAFPCVYVANEAANRGIFLEAGCEEGYSGIPWCKKLRRVLLFRRAEMAPS